MSPSTRSLRRGRDVVVPEIDTKPSFHTSGTAFSYEGRLTPPQSAHEIRRNSAASSTFFGPLFSGETPDMPCSMPTTPVSSEVGGHGLPLCANRHNQLFNDQACVDSFNTHHPMLDLHLMACHRRQRDTAWISPCNNQYLYQAEVSGHTQNALHDWWSGSQAQGTNMGGYPNELQTTMFANDFDIAADSRLAIKFDFNDCSPISYGTVPLSYTSQHSPAMDHGQQMLRRTANVVPSRLSRFEDITIDHHSHEASVAYLPTMQDSFGSYDSCMNEWEPMASTTPQLTDSVNDDASASSETMTTPTKAACKRGRGRRSHGSRRQGRARKRAAPPRDPQVLLSLQEINEHEHRFELQVTSGQFHADENGNLVPQVQPRSSKPHKCQWHGCQRAFSRSEHLKRHEKSHSGDKPFPCPLPGCGREIGRSDNARDHLKTHMEAKGGKRNHFFPKIEIERAVREAYDQRTADRLLKNLVFEKRKA